MSCPSCEQCPMPQAWGTPSFDPRKAVEGDPGSPIWVVGLNPKTNSDDHTSGGINPMTWENPTIGAPHFERLREVLGPYAPQLLQPNGIAHTDLVKCGSPSYGDTEKNAAAHCKDFLIEQLKTHKPRLLLIVSSDASRLVQEAAGIPEDHTDGEWHFGGDTKDVCKVIFSGYCGPLMERFAKLRLARDFQRIAGELNLFPTKPE